MNTDNSWSQHDGNRRAMFPYRTKDMPVKEPFETACGKVGVIMPAGPAKAGAGARTWEELGYVVVWLAGARTPLAHDYLVALEPDAQIAGTAKHRCRPFKGTITTHLVPDEKRILWFQQEEQGQDEVG